MLLPLMSLPLWQSGFLCSHRPVLQWPDKCQRFPGPNPPAPWECACWSDQDCELSWWYPKGTERDDNIIKHLIPLLISLGNKMMFPQQCLSTFFKNSFYFYYWFFFYQSYDEKTFCDYIINEICFLFLFLLLVGIDRG